MEENILQLVGNYGVLGLLCYFAIKEFFAWLPKKNGSDNGNKVSKEDKIQDTDIVRLQTQVETILTNHLPHIQKELEKNTGDHTDIKVLLGKICQKLEID